MEYSPRVAFRNVTFDLDYTIAWYLGYTVCKIILC